MNVDVSSDGPVRIITINRPEARNAVDGPTAAALANAFRDFDADDRLSVGVLTGAGGTFCAGADLKSFGTERANSVDDDGDGPMGPSRMMLSKPVLAAVEGFAVAGGLELAIWCDLRIAARDAVFGVFCRRWGVPLIDGGTVRLPRLIGHSHALDLILTGRGVEGEEALRMGLANRLTEPGEALGRGGRPRPRARRAPADLHAHGPPVLVRAVGSAARCRDRQRARPGPNLDARPRPGGRPLRRRGGTPRRWSLLDLRLHFPPQIALPPARRRPCPRLTPASPEPSATS